MKQACWYKTSCTDFNNSNCAIWSRVDDICRTIFDFLVFRANIRNSQSRPNLQYITWLRLWPEANIGQTAALLHSGTQGWLVIRIWELAAHLEFLQLAINIYFQWWVHGLVLWGQVFIPINDNKQGIKYEIIHQFKTLHFFKTVFFCHFGRPDD